MIFEGESKYWLGFSIRKGEKNILGSNFFMNNQV